MNGIGDSFLLLGRVPIKFLGMLGFRFSLFYTSKENPARKILEPFFREIRYCEFTEREPTAREKWLFGKMMSLSMRTTKIWRPPFRVDFCQNIPKGGPKTILLHTHLDGHHGWKGATAKIWPLENWAELCNRLHTKKWEISVLEWDESARAELFSKCPYLIDGRKKDLLETVASFREYDFLFSIDSWSKYVAVWFDMKQLVGAADVRKGYPGNETTTADRLAKWWFHGIIGHRNAEVIGLEKKEKNSFIYTLDKIADMDLDLVARKISKSYSLKDNI
jgi:hypothetical protein